MGRNGLGRRPYLPRSVFNDQFSQFCKVTAMVHFYQCLPFSYGWYIGSCQETGQNYPSHCGCDWARGTIWTRALKQSGSFTQNSASCHTSSTRSSFWGHPFHGVVSLAGPSQEKRSCSPSRPFSTHHGKRTWINYPQVEVRSEHRSTWGDDYITELIPETRPSSRQQRQESSNPLLAPSALPPILMKGQPQAVQRILEIRHPQTQAYQGETLLTLT